MRVAGKILLKGSEGGIGACCVSSPVEKVQEAALDVLVLLGRLRAAPHHQSLDKTTQLQSLLDNTWLCEKNALWGFPLLSPAAAPPCALLRLAEGFTHPLSWDDIGRQLLHTLPRRVIQCSHCSLADL